MISMRDTTIAIGTESVRSRSQSSLVAVPISDHIHHSKRIKGSSSTVVATIPSSKLMNNINIDDLPEFVLVEILSRLPCYKFVSQCKCVSKRWCTLMSYPSFIGRFLCLQSDCKLTPNICTLINSKGVEFLTRLSSSGKPLTPLFKRLMSFHHLKEEPIVVGTYNDLVLCCASKYYQRDYYICNPYTYQWVSLPPPPQLCKFTPVGFICDRPYYQCREDEDGHDQKRQFIQLNVEYRYRVARLITYPEKKLLCKFKVQIFSSETGEWSESIVSSPSLFTNDDIDGQMSFPYNGVLYWLSDGCNFLIGIDPFMITDKNNISLPSTSSSSTSDDIIDHYKCRFIEFDQPDSYDPQCLGVDRGCLQILYYNHQTHGLSVWEFNEEEVSAGAGKFCLEQRGRDYALDWKMVPEDDDAEYLVFVLAFDPNNDGTLYLHIGQNITVGDIFMYNIHTGESLKIVERSSLQCCRFYPLARPWWPTPVSRLPRPI